MSLNIKNEETCRLASELAETHRRDQNRGDYSGASKERLQREQARAQRGGAVSARCC